MNFIDTTPENPNGWLLFAFIVIIGIARLVHHWKNKPEKVIQKGPEPGY